MDVVIAKLIEEVKAKVSKGKLDDASDLTNKLLRHRPDNTELLRWKELCSTSIANVDAARRAYARGERGMTLSIYEGLFLFELREYDLSHDILAPIVHGLRDNAEEESVCLAQFCIAKIEVGRVLNEAIREIKKEIQGLEAKVLDLTYDIFSASVEGQVVKMICVTKDLVRARQQIKMFNILFLKLDSVVSNMETSDTKAALMRGMEDSNIAVRQMHRKMKLNSLHEIIQGFGRQKEKMGTETEMRETADDVLEGDVEEIVTKELVIQALSEFGADMIIVEIKMLLDEAIIEIGKEKQGLDVKQKALTVEIKNCADQGKMGVVRAMAEDIIQVQHQIEMLISLYSQLSGVVLDMEAQTPGLEEAYGKALKCFYIAIKQTNEQIELPSLEKVIQSLEKQMEKMNMEAEEIGVGVIQEMAMQMVPIGQRILQTCQRWNDMASIDKELRTDLPEME